MNAIRRRIEQESGAVAVLFAVLAVVIIGAGALAVDLGNAFARKRITQTQADLAALAGAAKLPQGATTAAVDEAFNYLVKNEVLGQGDVSTLKTQMTNGNNADGEIWVQDDSVINVLTPSAQVDYALGGVFNQAGIDVEAYAQAGVFSPGVIAPFFIPFGCADPNTGGLPDNIFVKSGAEPTPTEPTPEFLTPMVPKKNDPPLVDTVVPTEMAFGASVVSTTINDANMEAGDPTIASADPSLDDPIQVQLGLTFTVDNATFTSSGPSVNIPDADVSGTTLTTAADEFVAGDVGNKIEIPGGGIGSAPRVTYIDSFVSETEVELATGVSSPLGPLTVETPGSVGNLTADAETWISDGAVDLATAPDLDVVNGTATIDVTNTDVVEITGDGFSTAGMEVAFRPRGRPSPHHHCAGQPGRHREVHRAETRRDRERAGPDRGRQHGRQRVVHPSSCGGGQPVAIHRGQEERGHSQHQLER